MLKKLFTAVLIALLLCSFIFIALIPLHLHNEYEQAFIEMNTIESKMPKDSYMILINVDDGLIGVYYDGDLINQFNQVNIASDVNDAMLTASTLLDHNIVLDVEVLYYFDALHLPVSTPVLVYNCNTNLI